MSMPLHRPRARVRPSWVFLLIVAVTGAGGWLSWQAVTDGKGTRFFVFLFVVGGWLVSLSVHEFSHAYLAHRFGDDEVAARGYLDLNPIRYAHPVLSILLPVLFILIGGIGLPGGAVWLNPHRFATDRQRSLVSVIGPLTNLGWALVLVGGAAHYGNDDHFYFWSAVAGLGLLQVMAAVLNLLPVPGLDGWGAIEPYLDPSVRRGADQFKPFGLLAIFALLQFQPLNRAFFGFVYWLFELSGLSRIAGSYGIELMRFWLG